MKKSKCKLCFWIDFNFAELWHAICPIHRLETILWILRATAAELSSFYPVCHEWSNHHAVTSSPNVQHYIFWEDAVINFSEPLSGVTKGNKGVSYTTVATYGHVTSISGKPVRVTDSSMGFLFDCDLLDRSSLFFRSTGALCLNIEKSLFSGCARCSATRLQAIALLSYAVCDIVHPNRSKNKKEQAICVAVWILSTFFTFNVFFWL